MWDAPVWSPFRIRIDITIVKALARAFRCRKPLESGRHATINKLAHAEKINASYVSRVSRLTLTARDIVEAILDGRPRERITLPALSRGVSEFWADQRATDAHTLPRLRQRRGTRSSR